VWFFEQSLIIEYRTALDLLFLAVAILLVSGALYLTHFDRKPKKPAK
jgi:phosphate starvation-inducible membrane PsiE